jgi:hypothetical protein
MQRSTTVLQRSSTVLQRSSTVLQRSSTVLQRSSTLLQRSNTMLQRTRRTQRKRECPRSDAPWQPWHNIPSNRTAFSTGTLEKCTNILEPYDKSPSQHYRTVR